MSVQSKESQSQRMWGVTKRDGHPLDGQKEGKTFACMGKKEANTYNSGDSLVVTHLTTNPPVHCLYMAERTGSLILSVLWSYVKE